MTDPILLELDSKQVATVISQPKELINIITEYAKDTSFIVSSSFITCDESGILYPLSSTPESNITFRVFTCIVKDDQVIERHWYPDYSELSFYSNNYKEDINALHYWTSCYGRLRSDGCKVVKNKRLLELSLNTKLPLDLQAPIQHRYNDNNTYRELVQCIDASCYGRADPNDFEFLDILKRLFPEIYLK